MEQPVIWRAALAAVDAITLAQPHAEKCMDGSLDPGHGSVRERGQFSDGGRSVTTVYKVGQPDHTDKVYRITVEDVTP